MRRMTRKDINKSKIWIVDDMDRPFLPSQWEFVGVCWCSVNMTVIFYKILNPTANLSQLVCWSLLAFVCAVWIGLMNRFDYFSNFYQYKS